MTHVRSAVGGGSQRRTLATANMQQLQETGFGSDREYHIGSPHLRHWQLHERLVNLLRDSVATVVGKGMAPTVLEVGAGHGGFTGPALALGCDVTATEMSRPSVERLRHKFWLNPHFTGLFDDGGSLTVLGDKRFSIILCASVLHHIPDYFSFIEGACTEHLDRGGTFLSIQDPLWYPDISRSTLLLSNLAYYAWRLPQGRYIAGAKTRWRRLRGRYDEQDPADMVEYHVVRKGVNHEEINGRLDQKFLSVNLIPYWSCNSLLFQHLGEVLGIENTFALRAEGYLEEYR